MLFIAFLKIDKNENVMQVKKVYFTKVIQFCSSLFTNLSGSAFFPRVNENVRKFIYGKNYFRKLHQKIFKRFLHLELCTKISGRLTNFFMKFKSRYTLFNDA